MKAEDTVETYGKLRTYCIEKGRGFEEKDLILAQAEISFEAGKDEESTQAYHAGLADGIERGRKEVVEWVANNKIRSIFGAIVIDTAEWDKKWGVE